MGRKGSWFSSVKKALSPDSKEKKSEKSNKSKKKWFGKEKSSVPDSSTLEPVSVSQDSLPVPPPEEVKLTEVEDEQTKHAYFVPVSIDAAPEAAETAVAAAAPVVETLRLAETAKYYGKSREEVAAIKIQTAFRGYLARRALRALRGLDRLKSLVEGPTVKRQTTNTLRCMQNLSRVQSQINSRRIRMSEENQALQRQLLQKRAKELESLQMGEDWDDSLQSKEQIEAKLLSKYEAAMRRERALAYSFSHQQPWKKSARPTNLLFMDPTNPQWGWSWMERWMSARPLESRSTADKESMNDHSSVRSVSFINISANEITKSYAKHQLNVENSPTTPHSNATFQFAPRKNMRSGNPRGSMPSLDDDTKSTFSVQSRRHSIAGSSVRDDESLGSSPSVPSYMASTQSAKAKSRTQSPLDPLENGGSPVPDKGSVVTVVKKRLSYPGSPAKPRRHSGPPKYEGPKVVVESNSSIGVEHNVSSEMVI